MFLQILFDEYLLTNLSILIKRYIFFIFFNPLNSGLLYAPSASVLIMKRPPVSKYPRKKTSNRPNHPLVLQHIEHDAAEIREILKGHKNDGVRSLWDSLGANLWGIVNIAWIKELSNCHSLYETIPIPYSRLSQKIFEF